MTKIVLPPLPEPVAIADGTFNCNAQLGTELFREDQLRARDLEVARVMLAALVSEFQAHPLMDLQPSDIVEMLRAVEVGHD